MEVADRITLELGLLARFLTYIGQPTDAMALQAAVQ